MSLEKSNNSRVEFVATFFETLRQLNEHVEPPNQLPFDLVRSLLLLAVTSDKNLIDQFDKVQDTGDSVADIMVLKSHILSKASLYDGKQQQAAVPKTRLELKAAKHSVEEDDETFFDVAFFDVEQYSTYQHELAAHETATYSAFRTNTAPGGKVPGHIWSLMNDAEQDHWASISLEHRSKIIEKNNANYSSGPHTFGPS